MAKNDTVTVPKMIPMDVLIVRPHSRTDAELTVTTTTVMDEQKLQQLKDMLYNIDKKNAKGKMNDATGNKRIVVAYNKTDKTLTIIPYSQYIQNILRWIRNATYTAVRTHTVNAGDLHITTRKQLEEMIHEIQKINNTIVKHLNEEIIKFEATQDFKDILNFIGVQHFHAEYPNVTISLLNIGIDKTRLDEYLTARQKKYLEAAKAETDAKLKQEFEQHAKELEEATKNYKLEEEKMYQDAANDIRKRLADIQARIRNVKKQSPKLTRELRNIEDMGKDFGVNTILVPAGKNDALAQWNQIAQDAVSQI
jgi:hypothetical protein